MELTPDLKRMMAAAIEDNPHIKDANAQRILFFRQACDMVERGKAALKADDRVTSHRLGIPDARFAELSVLGDALKSVIDDKADLILSIAEDPHLSALEKITLAYLVG